MYTVILRESFDFLLIWQYKIAFEGLFCFLLVLTLEPKLSFNTKASCYLSSYSFNCSIFIHFRERWFLLITDRFNLFNSLTQFLTDKMHMQDRDVTYHKSSSLMQLLSWAGLGKQGCFLCLGYITRPLKYLGFIVHLLHGRSVKASK